MGSARGSHGLVRGRDGFRHRYDAIRPSAAPRLPARAPAARTQALHPTPRRCRRVATPVCTPPRFGPNLAYRDGMEITRRTPRIARLVAASTLVLWAGSAQALSIGGITVATDAANTANASGTAGANRFQIASSAGLVGSAPAPVADVAGASVSFDTRYAALLAADREAGGGTTAQSATASYTITFTVDNPTGGAYRIDIDTSRVGALTLVTDSGGSASASLGAVTALVDGAATPSLGLGAVGPLSGAAGGNQGARRLRRHDRRRIGGAGERNRETGGAEESEHGGVKRPKTGQTAKRRNSRKKKRLRTGQTGKRQKEETTAF